MKQLSTVSIGILFVITLMTGMVGTAIGAEERGPIVTSSGKVTIVNAEGPFVMIQKEDGKRVSLELTPETTVTLDGQALPVDQLSALEPGFIATAEHYTNDQGMQQTVRLVVQRQASP